MLANLAERAGRTLGRRGSKARRATGVGRAKAALPRVRARPLEGKRGVSKLKKRAIKSIDLPLEHDELSKSEGDEEGGGIDDERQLCREGEKREERKEPSENTCWVVEFAGLGAFPFWGGFADFPAILRAAFLALQRAQRIWRDGDYGFQA